MRPRRSPLIDRLCADLARIIQEDGLAGFHTVQVKEKFGGLRFYCQGGNDRVWERIDQAEAESEITCESCGARQHPVRDQGGWLSTRCDSCVRRTKRDSQ